MNTTKAPFDDLKVRQAVNYAVDPAALERIYAGQLDADPADPAARDARLPEVRPLPARHGQGEAADRRSQPLRPRHHRLDRRRKPQRRSRAPTTRTCSRTRLQREAEDHQRRQLLHGDRQRHRPPTSTPAGPTGSRTTRTRTTSSSRCSPAKASCRPTTATSPRSTIPALNTKIDKLGEEPLGPKQEAEYAAARPANTWNRRPGLPTGPGRSSTFVSSDIDLDKVICNPTFGARPDQLPVQVAAAALLHNTAVARPAERRRAPTRRRAAAPGAWPSGGCARNRVALGFLGALPADRRLRPRGAALGQRRRPHRARTHPHAGEDRRRRRRRATSSTPTAPRSARSGSAPAASSSSAPTAASAATRWCG